MNLVMLSGRLVYDPELTEVGGTKKCDFVMAVKKNGSKDRQFLHCTAWKNLAENLVKFMKKGGEVIVIGETTAYDYIDAQKMRHVGEKTTAEKIEFLSTAAASNKNDDEEQKEPEDPMIQELDKQARNQYMKDNPGANPDKIFNQEKIKTISDDDLPF